jgi:hypothetical protein
LFLDVSIQTNSVDKSKIFLRAGQKVIVLKSPRGICLQLESGKVIAIRASMKPGQSGDLKTPGIPGFNDTSSSKSDASVALGLSSASLGGSGNGDVIDMTNSDDEESGVNKLLGKSSSHSVNNGNATIAKLNNANEVGSSNNNDHSDSGSPFKEKQVYKPNLVQRKPQKIMPPSTGNSSSTIGLTQTTSSITTATSSMYPNDRNRGVLSSSYGPPTNCPPQQKMGWNRFQSPSTSNSSSSSSNYYRDMNGGAKNDQTAAPFQNRK